MIHIHPFEIFLGLILKISLFVFIPVFLYLYALSIQEILPFKYLEIYLILAYIKIIYDIFNWYNDVWIVTDKAIITLVWSFLKNKSETINYENIE
ncbi:MAG: hypothetical protein LBF15_04905 [Candidatus Peribacteria bacterium]|nr:hypothetical protein [Candidatus Peribacteria bacterium]